MNYSRQEFVDEKTVLKAEMLEHIEDGILNCEKDNFLLQCGKSFSSNLYKKEALRANPLDAIEGFRNEKTFVKISSKAPSMSDFSNGFSLSFDAPLGLGDDFFSYMLSFYKDILPEALAELAVGLSAELGGGATLPITLELPSAEVFPSISDYLPLILKTDEELENCYFLGLFGDDDEFGLPLLLFVTEDTFVEGTEKLEKGVYLITIFGVAVGVTLYINNFSFEEEKKEEELPIIESYGNTITWDGNINGLTWFSVEDDLDYLKFYKVSNNVPSYEELLNGYKIRILSESYTPETTQGPVTEGKEVEIDSSKVLSDLQVGSNYYLLGSEAVIIVFKQAEGEDSIDASPGTYLIKVDEEIPPYYVREIISSFTTYGFNNWVPIVTNEKKEQGIFLYLSDKLLEGDLYLYKTPSAVEGARVSYNELKTWVNEKKHILISNPYSTYFSSVNIYDFSNENFGRIITQLNMEGSSIELVPVPLFTAEYVGGEN